MADYSGAIRLGAAIGTSIAMDSMREDRARRKRLKLSQRVKELESRVDYLESRISKLERRR
jgi:uncharacterized protein Yka (UPF0111/DUF47 family)